MIPLLLTYTHGTHRLVPPEQTLTRITPCLPACGITRCADVTGLDVDLGVPTFCAIRPTGQVLQTSNGKGLTRLSAKVSALMEAIELDHAENPDPGRLRRTSLNGLARSGLKALGLAQPGASGETFFSPDYIVDWVEGEELLSGEKVWLPASSAYFIEPAAGRTSTNGLASGNHLVEATLHALYELIERDAISSLEANGRLQIKEKCQVIHLATLPDDELQAIIAKIEAARSKLVLLWLPGSAPVHTFWAVLLNRTPFSAVSTLNAGYGTHLDLKVAAARAITEAVQSRLTLIHGSRDDIVTKPVYRAETPENSRAYHYFDGLASATTWPALEARFNTQPSLDLRQSYASVLAHLRQSGHRAIIRVDLTKADFNIPVVKAIIPSLRFNRRLF